MLLVVYTGHFPGLYSWLPTTRTVANSNHPLTRSNFHLLQVIFYNFYPRKLELPRSRTFFYFPRRFELLGVDCNRFVQFLPQLITKRRQHKACVLILYTSMLENRYAGLNLCPYPAIWALAVLIKTVDGLKYLNCHTLQTSFSALTRYRSYVDL